MSLPAAASVAPDAASTAPASGGGAALAWAALVMAVVSLAGSLFLSLGMSLKACPLCFYQRTFMMSLVAVLAMGLLTGEGQARRLALLALPVAMAGFGVACFHVWLEVSGKLECPQGVLGLGTAPVQSLAAFTILVGLLTAGAGCCLGGGVSHWSALAGAAVLGALLAVGASTSNPPMPSPPKEPYKGPPDICRPPYHAATS